MFLDAISACHIGFDGKYSGTAPFSMPLYVGCAVRFAILKTAFSLMGFNIGTLHSFLVSI